MNAPVLFLIYNRPEHTSRVFEAIRKMKPSYLFIAADGPRANKPGDDVACNSTRLIATSVDWPCKVMTFFRDENIGLRKAIPESISWFFEHVEEGIILEDDCLPTPGFFRFTQHLLERYRSDERIAHINGSNFLLGKKPDTKGSYYFSNIYH
ncbi:MAG: nucleotide-diphospho-sugar transferase, partial [Bacteroidota bacterium]